MKVSCPRGSCFSFFRSLTKSRRMRAAFGIRCVWQSKKRKKKNKTVRNRSNGMAQFSYGPFENRIYVLLTWHIFRWCCSNRYRNYQLQIAFGNFLLLSVPYFSEYEVGLLCVRWRRHRSHTLRASMPLTHCIYFIVLKYLQYPRLAHITTMMGVCLSYIVLSRKVYAA